MVLLCSEGAEALLQHWVGKQISQLSVVANQSVPFKETFPAVRVSCVTPN